MPNQGTGVYDTYSGANRIFYDKSGNTIFTIDGTNR